MDYKITSRCVEDTMELAENIESEKFPGMIICLDGELGSGKTVFSKAFAHAMGIDGVTSSTFNIIKEYNGELPLYHMDVYRLEDGDESIGFDDYFKNEGICIIEWAELIEDSLPEERLDIKFRVIDEDTRIIKLTPHGQKYEDIVNYVI